MVYDSKQETLNNRLYSFERASGLAALIKVDRLRRSEYYKMEEISSALNAIKIRLKKANAL